MEMPKNAVNWVEIPVADFERAKAFYSKIFDYQMPETQMGPVHMGFLLHDQQGGGVGGAIVAGEGYEPTPKGAKVYLNAGADLSVVLNRVEAAGGKVIFPKTVVTPELGYFAALQDSEGNHIYLHSMG